jgi:ATP-binding cassette subfamily B protein
VLTLILKKYLAPYKVGVLAVSVLLLLQSIATLYLPRYNADIINKGVLSGNTHYIITVGLKMLAISLAVMIASIGISFYASRISMAFGRDLRTEVFTAVERFSTRELNIFGAPSLITRNTNDVQQIQMVLFLGLTMMLGAPITGIGAIILAVNTNVKLSALLLVSVPLMGIIIFFLLRRIVPLFRLNQKKIDRINLVLREQIAGVRVVRAFVKTKQEEQRFAIASEDLMQTTLKVTRTFAVMFPVLTLILNLSTAAVVWFGGYLISDGKLEIGNLGAFISYLMQILMSVMMAVMMSLMIPRAAASAERVQEVLATESSVSEPTNPKKFGNVKGVVTFNNVEFSYPGAQTPVLENISFTANPGQFTAIVGSTGSGKTTLLNLIARFVDPTKGEVLIDGVNIKEVGLEELWSKLAVVPQKALLFGGTVAQNLRYGDANASDEDLWKALEIAQGKDFIEANADQLGARVAQGGSNFSGGQRQRLSIARALVKKAPICILDDSFSALDYATDAKLREALHHNMNHATLIVVAQRVSTILEADQIIVLDEGKIVGIGKHRDLMASCNTYKEIVLSQLSPEEAA